ncbi:MAG: zinc ribbon domain-containing protein [Phycisphaerae bacterium]|jgi:putative FmdB family regulatory protein
MPTYEYQAVEPDSGCDRCRTRFEFRQSIHDEPLKACPVCGRPVRKLVSLTGVSTQPSVKSMLSDRNLKAKGFTKLVNEGGGRFRKVT